VKKLLIIAAFVAPFLANVALADETAPAGGDKPATKSSKKSSHKKSAKTEGDSKAAAPAKP
jgi:hypothetical protein